MKTPRLFIMHEASGNESLTVTVLGQIHSDTKNGTVICIVLYKAGHFVLHLFLHFVNTRQAGPHCLWPSGSFNAIFC